MAYEGGLGDAPGTLGLEVPQGSDDPGGQTDDDDEVEHAQEPQGDVGQGPDDGQGQDGAAEGRSGQDDPEDLLGPALSAQEVDVDLGVGVAAEHRGEDQDEDEHHHGPGGPGT